MATTTDRIEAIDVKIDGIVSDPKPSYKIGDKSMSWNEYYSFLLKAKEALQKSADAEIEIVDFASVLSDELGNN